MAELIGNNERIVRIETRRYKMKDGRIIERKTHWDEKGKGVPDFIDEEFYDDTNGVIYDPTDEEIAEMDEEEKIHDRE